MLTVHHLHQSQSERIVWLCEELGLAYDLRCYDRDPVTRLAPPQYKALHPMGIAPVIEDDGVLLGESGAVIDYIIAKHGGERLTLAPTDPDFATYLYWLHSANGTLQPAMGRNMMLSRLKLPADTPMVAATQARLALAVGYMDRHLADRAYLAGSALTTADIMTVFTLTTMRAFYPLDLKPYPNVLAYLKRIAEVPSYRRAMEKGDPGMTLLLD